MHLSKISMNTHFSSITRRFWIMPCLAVLAGGASTFDGVSATVLGIDGVHFTVNGQPTFLLGLSYYGALGASKEFIRRDLDDAQHDGFNWLRVWATWGAFDHDVSAVGTDGRAREPYLDKLKWLMAECDRRGVIVDITLTRGKASAGGCIPDMAAHRRALETLISALKPRRNWYLDLANEHDVGDARFASASELKELRELIRQLDPPRLVTASWVATISANTMCAKLYSRLVWTFSRRTDPALRSHRLKPRPRPALAWP